MKRQHIDSIFYLRLFAMLMVVLVHVTGTYQTVLPEGSDAFQKYHFLNRFIRIEAGIFLMLTGLVFFYNFFRKDLSPAVFRDYYKKRVVYILVPYLIWALFYEFYASYTIGRELDVIGVAERILQGKSYYQLHFIFLIVQFYLVFPLLILLAKKFRWFRRYMWLIGIVVHLLYNYLNTRFNLVGFGLFLNSMTPYLLGGWIGIYYEEQKGKIHNNFTTLMSGIVFFVSGTSLVYLNYHLYTVGTFHLDSFYYTVNEVLFIVTGCYFLYRMAEILHIKAVPAVRKTVKHVAVYSFGFYLIHPFVLKEVTRWIPVHNNYWFHVEMAARYALTVLLCYLIILSFHRFVPGASLIFGKLPKRK
ncbi:acyltransferase [Virgibacillus sediminis]|uniref:Acyltransferase n=1 Tax=Virgibacillus sediminis TaxID=202260 RepID=A0ABV7A3P1_9BACI